MPHEGGRVTELTARPLLNVHWPALAGFSQPLAGEFAARRSLLEKLPFPVGYGVEIATLIDTFELEGLDAIAQVALGTRQNAHKSLRDLTMMSYAILFAVEKRIGRRGRLPIRCSSLGRETLCPYLHQSVRRYRLTRNWCLRVNKSCIWDLRSLQFLVSTKSGMPEDRSSALAIVCVKESSFAVLHSVS